MLGRWGCSQRASATVDQRKRVAPLREGSADAMDAEFYMLILEKFWQVNANNK